MAARKRWFRLDNAAKLYPAISTDMWSSTFRLSVFLADPVQPDILQRALDRTLPRFPTMKVRMRTGVFWYYLEEIKAPLRIRPDAGDPCMPFRYHQDHGYLLRVFYDWNRISAEFFHALTDGTGGLTFLKTLTVEYLRLLGKRVFYDHGALNPHQPPSPEETEDAFLRLPLPKYRVSRRESRAYHFPATPEIPHTLHIIGASMPCEALLKAARERGASVTEYLAAVMIWCGIREQMRCPKKRLSPVRVSVPVNLRAFFPSGTLRNFSSFINPGVDPALGEYTFEEVLAEVRAFIRYQLNPKLLSAVLATNVTDEKNLAVRLAPLVVKNLVISGIFRRAGDKLITATLSNLGKTDVPTGAEKLIGRFEFHLGVPFSPLCNAAVITTGDETRLMFSSNIRETALPRAMLRFLVEAGIPVTVESNMEET